MKRIFKITNRVFNRVLKVLISVSFLKFATIFCIVAGIYYLLTALGLTDGVLQRVWNQSEIWRRVTVSISFIVGGYVFWGLRAVIMYRRAAKEIPLRSELNQIKKELAAIKEAV